MTKKIGLFLAVFLCTIMSLTTVKAQTTTTVSNQEQLKSAIADKNISTIVLNSDINTTEKIHITRDLTIDGNNHTIRYTGTFGKDNSKDNKVWGGIYVLHVYKATATIKNIKLTGANAALLANGANVTLVGTIDVSGNGFGGIELGQGKDVDETVKLNLDDNCNIVNTTESATAPTLWVPSDSDDAIVSMNGVEKIVTSGDELALSEVNALFEGIREQSPQTGDNLSLYIILGSLGICGLGLSTKFMKKNS